MRMESQADNGPHFVRLKIYTWNAAWTIVNRKTRKQLDKKDYY